MFRLAKFLAPVLLVGGLTFFVTSAGETSADFFVPAPVEGLVSDTSENWAGYVATEGEFTEIGGGWVVAEPDTRGVERMETDATWVGIGGVEGRDLIQAGTEATVLSDGTVRYDAWYELLPDYQRLIPIEVSGGDFVYVTLKEVSEDRWHLTFENRTRKVRYEADLYYESQNSSAEWVQEMPIAVRRGHMEYIPLDRFGSVTFTGGYAVMDGERRSIEETEAVGITMAPRGVLLASPGALTGGTFTVIRSANEVPSTEVRGIVREERSPSLLELVVLSFSRP
jgi:hypothetical protein